MNDFKECMFEEIWLEIIERDVKYWKKAYCVMLPTFPTYSKFHRFRSQVARRLFLSQLWPLLKWASLFEAAGAVAKIGSSLKLNHHNQI